MFLDAKHESLHLCLQWNYQTTLLLLPIALEGWDVVIVELTHCCTLYNFS